MDETSDKCWYVTSDSMEKQQRDKEIRKNMYLLQIKSVKPVNEEKPVIDGFNDFEARQCYSGKQRKPMFYLGIL